MPTYSVTFLLKVLHVFIFLFVFVCVFVIVIVIVGRVVCWGAMSWVLSLPPLQSSFFKWGEGRDAAIAATSRIPHYCGNKSQYWKTKIKQHNTVVATTEDKRW